MKKHDLGRWPRLNCHGPLALKSKRPNGPKQDSLGQRPRCQSLAALMVLLLAGQCLADAPKYTVKTAKADLPSGVSADIKKTLQADSITINDENNSGVMKLWPVQNISSTASNDQIKNGLTYREWTEGSIIGLLQLEQPWVDYRKQTIPVGVYTLRLGFQPDTGDHKDTAPSTEFLLLSPVEADTKTESLAANDIVKLSKKATGNDHPGVMLLLIPKETSKIIELKSNDNTLSVLTSLPVKTSETTGTVYLQAVVWGHSAKR